MYSKPSPNRPGRGVGLNSAANTVQSSAVRHAQHGDFNLRHTLLISLFIAFWVSLSWVVILLYFGTSLLLTLITVFLLFLGVFGLCFMAVFVMGWLGIVRRVRSLVVAIGTGLVTAWFFEVGIGILILMCLMMLPFDVFLVAKGIASMSLDCYDPTRPGVITYSSECMATYGWQPMVYAFLSFIVGMPMFIGFMAVHTMLRNGIKNALNPNVKMGDVGSPNRLFDLNLSPRPVVERRAVWFVIDSVMLPITLVIVGSTAALLANFQNVWVGSIISGVCVAIPIYGGFLIYRAIWWIREVMAMLA